MNTLKNDTPTDEQLLERLEAFCVEQVRPRSAAIDREREFFPDLLSSAAELGLQSLLFGEDGELRLDRTGLIHETTERIAAESAPVALAVSVARLHTYLLARYADPELQERYIGPTVRAEIFGAFAISEPQAGTDIRALTSVARREGDTYVLNGSKCWIGLAPVCSYAIVLAKVDSDARDAATVALVVDMSSAGAHGEAGTELSGFRGMPNGTLTFEDVRVPAAHALRCDGFAGMMDGLNMARIEAASYACGFLRRAIELSVDRAATREAFGGRIGDLPSIQTKIGRMSTAYQAARLLTLAAAESFSDGDGGNQDIISMAKLFASDEARKHTDEAMQIFGGEGLAADSPTLRLHRDAKVTQIFDGTSEIHETMLGRRAVRQHLRGGLGYPFVPVS
ncbi:acyl-CoA dehydrogenase family protein [Leucobacter celer]|jgi:alkylation response protein AidB-like acyl-CoA dehydrogenase|uniref:acyl-CoA dehydrogenase family protein n=1 Tax=Leucobacter celer TaxID=668625 RepID=UPI0006A7DCCC|nr:acyl-CoA dehydrogenase family protein [Leucobacter celer]